MAEKKSTTKAAAKKAAAAEEAKTTEVSSEVKDEAKETVKKAGRGAAAKKAPVKKTVSAAKKETVKEEPVKEVENTAEEAGEKSEVKAVVNFQFGGKSYSPEDLMKICKDVWKFDLNGKEEDLKSVELYVKPEENITYYVINGDVTGSFFI